MRTLPVCFLISILFLSCQPVEKKPEKDEQLSREANPTADGNDAHAGRSNRLSGTWRSVPRNGGIRESH